MSKKVFIGVGHGGSDPGAKDYIIEKEYTLKTAFALAEILSEYGVDYKLSRTQDIDTDMNSKTAMCNKYDPDLVVDIHLCLRFLLFPLHKLRQASYRTIAEVRKVTQIQRC